MKGGFMNEFVALDVETSNERLSSICSIGLVKFSNGIEVDHWTSLIDPDQPFSEFNTNIHGIKKQDVIGAPTFQDVYPILKNWIENQFVVHHTNFDRSAIAQSIKKVDLPPLFFISVDSARAVRRTWRKYADQGYGLSNVAFDFKIKFEHHNALEDARAAGLIMNEAIKESGIKIEDWPEWISSRRTTFNNIDLNKINSALPDPKGHLYGEVIVFTGTLTLTRVEALQLAYKSGCDVDSNVTKKTTLLVVGIQNMDQMVLGETKSSKHRKAEKLIMEGQQIKIITEEDFISLVS